MIPVVRKTYTPPTLVVYGSITEITKQMDNAGSGDGGMGSTDKT